jgi:hypothetical protein
LFGRGGVRVRVPEDTLESLRAAGLLVAAHFFPPNHVGWPDGSVVCKPRAAGGNCIPLYADAGPPGDEAGVIDAPRAVLHAERGKWLVTVREGIPLPGPGDFVNVWDTAERAAADVLDYFFGDPSRMLVKRRAVEAEEERIARWVAEHAAEPGAPADPRRGS